MAIFVSLSGDFMTVKCDIKTYEAIFAHVKFTVVHWLAEGVSAMKY